MLTQQEADRLMAISKQVVAQSAIGFPKVGDLLQIPLKSTDGREEFLVDVNRRGRIKLTKCTFQERYAVVEILLR